MARCIGICFALTLLVVLTTAYDDKTFDRALRTLTKFAKLKQAAEEKRRDVERWEKERSLDDLKETISCKEEGEACKGLPSCCGDLKCYWPEGLSLRNDGVCVECIKENRTCQLDSQCCPDLHCEKDNSLNVDGVCIPPGCSAEGQSCRKDSHCCGTELQCNKGNFFWVNGDCERYRRSGPCYRDGQCVTQCTWNWQKFEGECS